MQMMRLLLSTPVLLLSANASVVFGSDVRGTGLEKELHDKQQLARSLHLFDDPPEGKRLANISLFAHPNKILLTNAMLAFLLFHDIYNL